ncbi:TPA: DUF2972 domain-containing protein [Campylobacter coli]|nr:DUF2972 domain-containing protein [Campylobacter coli]
MHNPQSAIERIKNSLSYKLGSAILEHKKQYGRGFLILIYKLYKIKKQHFRDQKLYKQVTKIFPQLAYPKLETCSDYNESIRYKYHLSYMLGEVLIHAHKTWHKGGYFKLYKNIQIIKRQYNLLKELSLNNIDISLENKELLINNFEAIKDILQTHKDYKPILENIFHNFKFFLVNLTLIKEWLLSDDFYQRYKKENHPYPSLLDPKKLNNDSEEINYKNIPAELAWEMNLPLPDKYKFVYLAFGLSGHGALKLFLQKSLPVIGYLNPIEYIYSISKDACFFIYIHQNNDMEKAVKFLYRVYSQRILFLIRDPIERLKHAVNHGWYAYIHQKAFDEYNVELDSIGTILDRVQYIDIDNIDCLLKNLNYWIDTACFKYNTILKYTKSDIFYIDMSEIMPNYAFSSIDKLSRVFDFRSPSEKEKKYYEEIKSSKFRYILPIVIQYKDLKINITLKQEKPYSCIDIGEYIGYRHPILELICFSINEKEMDKMVYLQSKYMINFFNNFLSQIDEKTRAIEKKKATCSHILRCINNELKVKLKNIFDQELIHIKKYRPDIVASWKYYQEFEKL